MSNWILVVMTSCLCVVLPSITSGQGIRDSAREHARKGSSEPMFWAAPPSDFARKSIAEMAREALLVVEASLWRGESYLGGSDSDRVITEYSMVVTNVLAGELPGKTKVSLPLTVTIRGGEVQVEGIVVRETNGNYSGELLDGAGYLLFLRTSRPPVEGRYEVFNGGILQISGEHARSLRRPPPEEIGGDRGLTLANVRADINRGRTAR